MESFFRELTLSVCGSLDIHVGLRRTLPILQRYLPADGLGLGYSDVENARMEVVGWVGSHPPWASPTGEGFSLDNAGVQYVQFEGAGAPSPLIINTPGGAPPGLLRMFPGLQSQSVVFLRLVMHNDEVGALVVWARGHGRYRDEHARLLQTVVEPLTLAMVNARTHHQLKEDRDRLAEDNRSLSHDLHADLRTEIVGADFGLREVMRQVRRIAPSNRPALLTGETGTGKEVIANALHLASRRNLGPFITLQCGAVPDTLLDSELFGHEKGAFTGATSRKRGRFERAHRGSLFLDEIGE
ncbi:MAG: sigma 54-interacting transcriptional regulator, partial [Myxococcota bacterium]